MHIYIYTIYIEQTSTSSYKVRYNKSEERYFRCDATNENNIRNKTEQNKVAWRQEISTTYIYYTLYIFILSILHLVRGYRGKRN